jgi:pimeloyl-ACP methyl ester carboxylesterase
MASDLSFDQARLLVQRGIVKENKLYVWRVDSRVKSISPYRLTLGQAKQLIEDISCPVLLIYGTTGLDLVSTRLKHFAPIFKNLQMVELTGGHHVHIQQAQQAAALIDHFIDKR